MTYRIRKARVEDLPAIYSFELAYIQEIEPADEQSWKNAVHSHLTQWITNLSRMFVATDEDRIVGHCFWQCDGTDAVLASLYVSPAARRQGLGSRLLRRFERDATLPGVLRLMLGVHMSNPAFVLYERVGYLRSHTAGCYHHYDKLSQATT